jgi:hypothetical protein
MTFLFVSVIALVHTVKAEFQPEGQFHFSVNPIPDPEETIIQINLTNVDKQPLEFEAPTSQWFDITITDQQDKIVYRYSDGRSFLQAFQQLTLNPGETKKWSVNIKEPYGKQLNPGTYTVTAVLKAITVNGKDLKSYHNLIDQKEMVVPPKNPIIRNVMLNLQNDRLEIRGNAKHGNIFYVIEDGHREWVKETMVKVNGKYSAWGDFTIKLNLPEGKEPLTLYLYVKDQNGRLVHIYPKQIK